MRSTANLFDLPMFYQYGVGSAGFGVWREVAAMSMASNWVLTGACKNFSLMYHSRVLHNNLVPSVISESKLDKKVAYWNNSLAVRNRIESMQNATSSVVVFLENIPQTLSSYMMEKSTQGKEQFEDAIKMVDQNLQETASFMIRNGMLHFDAHADNIMTDGHRLYFADFGLAISSLFDLSPVEKDFFVLHKNYDKLYVESELVGTICQALLFEYEDMIDLLKKYVDGDTTITYSPYITCVLQKYAQSTLILDSFMSKLRKESKLTPYPAQEIEDTLV